MDAFGKRIVVDKACVTLKRSNTVQTHSPWELDDSYPTVVRFIARWIARVNLLGMRTSDDNDKTQVTLFKCINIKS